MNQFVDLFCGSRRVSPPACSAMPAKPRGPARQPARDQSLGTRHRHPFAQPPGSPPPVRVAGRRQSPRAGRPAAASGCLCASPECTHHSNAAGGTPRNEQSRATASHVVRWAEALYIDDILVENVREFVNWGPLGANGKPLKSKKGALFRNFIEGPGRAGLQRRMAHPERRELWRRHHPRTLHPHRPPQPASTRSCGPTIPMAARRRARRRPD